VQRKNATLGTGEHMLIHVAGGAACRASSARMGHANRRPIRNEKQRQQVSFEQKRAKKTNSET